MILAIACNGLSNLYFFVDVREPVISGNYHAILLFSVI